MDRWRIVNLVRAAAFLAVLFFVVLAPKAMAGGDVLVFVDEPLPPISIGQPGQEAEGGIALDLLHEVFGRLGRRVELRLAPFARALKSVRTGRADGMPLLMRSDDRERYMVFTDEVVRDRESFYYLPSRLGEFTWHDYGDLHGLVVGLVHGYTYGQDFLRAVRAGRVAVDYAPDVEANLRKLLAGRVDLVLTGRFQFLAVTGDHPDWEQRIRRARPEVASYGWCMGLSRQRPGAAALVSAVNGVLADMRRDGTLERIFRRRDG